MKANITILTDSYKIGHYPMYPEDTEYVYSYFEARKGATYNKTVFYGLQYLIKEYLTGKVVTEEKIKQGKDIMDIHLGPGIFNLEGWEYILKVHGGHLPIRIKAVLEGTPVPTSNVLMTVVNTDPKCYWLTNHLETLLSHVWSSSTVATLSREVKIMCKYYLEKTGATMDGLSFMLHDFGFRGVSSVESAGIEGSAHLINFKGTDTIKAIETAMEYYNSDVCAYSVNATEHSVMTSRGPEGEYQVFSDLVNKFPTGILSIVIDSYDYERFIYDYARRLKRKIIDRNGITVFRPDSGEPVTTTIHVLNLLGDVFGYSINGKGFKVLNNTKVLWGDGIEYSGIRNILHAMVEDKWSAENIVFGMGAGLLQKINRDTQRFAFKCSAQRRNGMWYDIFKKPKDVSKESKKGKLELYFKEDENTYYTSSTDNIIEDKKCLEEIFLNGKLLIDQNFSDIQERAVC